MDENNKSGSAAGVPPPSCFEGFWSEYHNEFKSSVNSNPLFRATAEGVTHRKEDAIVNEEGEKDEDPAASKEKGDKAPTKNPPPPPVPPKRKFQEIMIEKTENREVTDKEFLELQQKSLEVQMKLSESAQSLATSVSMFVNCYLKKNSG
jgi:hypothetical protein